MRWRYSFHCRVLPLAVLASHPRTLTSCHARRCVVGLFAEPGETDEEGPCHANGRCYFGREAHVISAVRVRPTVRFEVVSSWGMYFMEDVYEVVRMSYHKVTLIALLTHKVIASCREKQPRTQARVLLTHMSSIHLCNNVPLRYIRPVRFDQPMQDLYIQRIVVKHKSSLPRHSRRAPHAQFELLLNVLQTLLVAHLVSRL